MPTARPRHMVTETDDIAVVLDEAARRWPEFAENRAELVRLLLLDSLPELRRQRDSRLAERRQRILDSAGTLAGVWPADWREELRQDWPE